jgi:hypothetical protein
LALDHLRHGVLRRAGVGQIDVQPLDVARRLCDVEHDRCTAGLGNGLGDRAPQARCAAGDEHGSQLSVWHDGQPPR